MYIRILINQLDKNDRGLKKFIRVIFIKLIIIWKIEKTIPNHNYYYIYFAPENYLNIIILILLNLNN